jgi:hypothetical protein
MAQLANGGKPLIKLINGATTSLASLFFNLKKKKTPHFVVGTLGL